MKVPNRQVRWEHEPWTVVTQDGWPDNGCKYYAYNTRTGERKRPCNSYEAALASIKSDNNPHAEPWGV